MKFENKAIRNFRRSFRFDMGRHPNIPGRNIAQGAYSAFVPAPLPPALEWTPRLIGVLSEADRLIGRLAGEGGRLPRAEPSKLYPFLGGRAIL